MAIAEQELIEPATQLPRDARPSELVRGWPEERWCTGFAKSGDKFCAGGILAEAAGFPWARCGYVMGEGYVLPFKFIAKTYGIPYGVLRGLYPISDRHGKDAAADYLEAAGF